MIDLVRETAIKVFQPKIESAEFINEIERVKKISKLDFSPSILRWSLEDQWYEVDYVKGESGWAIAPANPIEFMENYNTYIAPLIETMVMFQTPLEKNLEDYIKKITDAINWEELFSSKLDKNKINSIKGFFDSIVERLSKEGNKYIKLVFSHGDFLPLNFVKLDNKVLVYDWEDSGYWSALHDLYNYFFTQMYWNMDMNLVSEIEEAINSLNLRLSSQSQMIANSIIDLSNIYRWIYYLERILIIMSRDPSEQILDITLQTVYIFDRHESILQCEKSKSNLSYANYYYNKTAGIFYDLVVYNEKSHDSYVWEFEKEWLLGVFCKLDRMNNGLKHLDFACGTGRIISVVEPITRETIGLDISEEMLILAREKGINSELRKGDILETPNIVSFDYDIITAFRFFLNIEPEMRKPIMKSLASRLNRQNGRLIFNIHGNKNKRKLRNIYNFLLRKKIESTEKFMSIKEIRSIVKDAGLEIERWYGLGVMPYGWHRGNLKTIMHFIDKIAFRLPLVKSIGTSLLFVCKLKD